MIEHLPSPSAPSVDVLFVDDEPNVVAALRRMLYPERHRWNMSFATSGAEALTLMEDQAFDVVVSDMQMPGMDGADLLRRIREASPATVRIVLSGQADQAAALKAAAVAHQFINKPADSQVLREAVERAGGLGRRLTRGQLRSALGGIDALPSPSATIRMLNSALSDPESDLSHIAGIIETDAGIASKVLQLVNSAFFALPREVSSVHQAVTYLGLDTIRALSGTVEMFRSLESDSTLSDMSSRLQSHGLRVLQLARHIRPDGPQDSDLFMGALLHDLGRLAIASVFPAHRRQLGVVTSARKILCAEVETLGADHTDIGAYLLSLWGFPLAAVEIVAHHHDAIRPVDGHPSALQAVQFAEALVEETSFPEEVDDRLHGENLEALGVDQLIGEWREWCGQLGTTSAAYSTR